jgi:hypothetical protein
VGGKVMELNMDKTRKKELLTEYKYRKTEMGVFVFECVPAGKSYIGCHHDTKSVLNSARFKPAGGIHKNKNLQKDWETYGESAFSIRVLEILPYDEKDEAKTDYTKELEVLRDKWVKNTENSEVI